MICIDEVKKEGLRKLRNPLISGGARRDRTVGLLNAIRNTGENSHVISYAYRAIFGRCIEQLSAAPAEDA